MYRYSPNRFLCDIFTDMRKAVEMLRFDLIPGLIEEAQIYGNRMEAKLDDQNDIKQLLEDKSKLNDEVSELSKKKEAIEKWLGGEENEEAIKKAMAATGDSLSDRISRLQNHPRDDGDTGC